MNIDALIVEVAALRLDPGDALLITPQRKLTKEEFALLTDYANNLKSGLGVKIVVGSHDLKLEVLEVDAA